MFIPGSQAVENGSIGLNTLLRHVSKPGCIGGRKTEGQHQARQDDSVEFHVSKVHDMPARSLHAGKTYDKTDGWFVQILRNH